MPGLLKAILGEQDLCPCGTRVPNILTVLTSEHAKHDHTCAWKVFPQEKPSLHSHLCLNVTLRKALLDHLFPGLYPTVCRILVPALGTEPSNSWGVKVQSLNH